MKVYLKTLTCFTVIVLISWHARSQSNTSVEKIDSIYSSYNSNTVPGIAISIIKNGAVAFHKSYGSANLEYEIPVNLNTAFNLCSVSKQFTVFALLLLEEEGILSLDDDIRKFIPELNNFDKTITLRHLASNSSGLRDDLRLLGMKGFTPDNVITQKVIDEITIRQKNLNFNPGSEFGYSNTGFNLLANVISKVSGISYAHYLEKNIFKPLKMDHSFVMDDFHKIIKYKAESYEVENGKFQYAPANYSYSGASGVYTTMIDFEKWALNFTNLKIGSRTIFNKMKTLNLLNNGDVSKYALGQFVDTYHGLKRVWHSGGDAGYRAYIGRFPEQDIVVLLLSNNASVYAEGEALKLADIYLEPSFKKKKSIKNNTKFKKLKRNEIQKFSGNYLHSKNYYTRKLLVREDYLVYSRPDQGGRESELKAISKNSFQLGNWQDTKVEFLEEKNIQIMNILIEGEIVDSFEKYNQVDYSNKELVQFEGEFFSEELQTKYILKIIDNVLTVKHPMMNDINLTSIKEDGFLSNAWQFNFVKYLRDDNGNITAIEVSTDRANNVNFKKI